MPTLARFAPPANLTDFTTEQQRKDWSKKISDFFDEAVQRVLAFAPAITASQFYNPTKADTPAGTAEAVIFWPGFPRKILNQFPGNKPNAWKDADKLSPQGFRRQDEYLEWHTTRNAQGKITRVVFTCEGPEYWDFLAATDPNKLVQLYRDLTGIAAIQKSDLIGPGNAYRRRNKFNTTDGAVHLTHPANSLSAEIFIAADATVKRKDDAGDLITDADELIECARFGEAGRASDPHIGDEVNKQARQNKAITLKDPVGLYINKIHDESWKLKDGSSATNNLFRIRRGKPGMALNVIFEAPAGSNFILGECKIDGRTIDFAGQIAEKIDVALTGVVFAKAFNNQAVECEGGAILAASPEELAGTRIAKE